MTGQLVKNIHGYTAVWLIDGHKHSRSIMAYDAKTANEEFKKILNSVKRRYDS